MSDWQAWIGKTTTSETQLDAARANHMVVTLDRDPGFRVGDALPPAWHWLYFHDLVKASDLGADGHPALGILMPPPMTMKGCNAMHDSSISTARLQRITAMLQTYLADQKLAGMSALVSHRGQVAYQTCLGMMDRKANKPVQFDTIFRIASMTKPVTSIAAKLLYEQGAFNLNTPVSQFIPAFKTEESLSRAIHLRPQPLPNQ